MKRSFTGPVWLLIIFGALLLAYNYFAFLWIFRIVPAAEWQSRVSPLLLTMLVWPLIFFGEAITYWVIRKRNRAQLLSWTHAVIFSTGFLIKNVIISALIILHHPIAAGLRTRQGRIVEAAVFWGLVIVSHVAFIQVLILAVRKDVPLKKPGEESENLLDDVVL